MQRPGPASTGHPAPHPSDIRPDGSHRDYANAKLIRCQQCGHRNVFPRDSAVLKCHKCGGDPTQPRRPIPAPWPKARPPLAPEQAAHYRNIALMSRTTAIMGLLPGILLAGITVTTIAPEAEGRSYDQGTAPGLFLFVLLVGYVSLAITLGRGRHPGLGPALAVCMLALVLGLVVGAAHRVPADHPGYGTAVGLSVALLITGLTAAVEAVAATSMLRGALLFYDRKVAIQGLVLGILDLTVGAATLACCR